MVTQLGAFLEHIEHLDACASDGWSQGVGEEVWTASLSEQVDDLFTTGGVAAGCAAESFTQSTGDDVNTALYATMLSGTTTVFANEANSVAVVNHNQSVVFVSQVANTLQVADDTVHGEYAVGSNQFDSCASFVSLFELRLEVCHVVVFVTESLCFAQTNTVDDGSMVELIADNCVFRSQDGLEETAVCIEAGGVEDGVIGAEEAGDLLLKLFVDILSTADETNGSNAVASLIVGSLSSVDQSLVVAQTEVVVCTHIDYGSAVLELNLCALWRYDRNLAFEKACCFNVFYFFGVDAQNVVFTCHF